MMAGFLLLTACGRPTPAPEAIVTEPATTEPAVTQPPATEPVAAEPLLSNLIQNILLQDEDTTAYTYTLTPELAEHYKEGYYILFQNNGDNHYLPFYYSRNLTLEGNTLKANFNGKIPYVLDNANRCCLTSITEMVEKDGQIHYAIDFKLGNYVTGEDGSEQYTAEPYRIHAVCDRETGQILHTQILPRNQSAKDIFQSGPPQLQPEPPAIYAFPLGISYYLVRNSDGSLRPCTMWDPSISSTGTSWPGPAGLNLAYGRLSEVTSPVNIGDVYLVFLVYDQDGNAYGSELIPVSVQEVSLPEPPKIPPQQISWDSGNRILLTQAYGTSIYLRKTTEYGNIVYDIQMLNESGLSMKLQTSDILFNDRFLGIDTQVIRAEPGEWGGSRPFPTPIAAAFGELGKIDRLTFHLKLLDASGDLLLDEWDFQVDLSGSAAQKAFYYNSDQLDVQQPYREFLAIENQVLMEQDGVQVSLMKAGTVEDSSSLTYVYRVENTTEEWRHFVHSGTAINDVYFSDGSMQLNLPPETVYHHYIHVSNIPGSLLQVGSVKLGLGIGTGKAGRSPVKSSWYPIEPKTAVSPTVLEEGTQLLLQEQGLRLTLIREKKNADGTPGWELMVVNSTDENIVLTPTYITAVDPLGNVTENLVSFESYKVGANQRALISITGRGDSTISFRMRATDFTDTQTLFETEGRIELTSSQAAD